MTTADTHTVRRTIGASQTASRMSRRARITNAKTTTNSTSNSAKPLKASADRRSSRVRRAVVKPTTAPATGRIRHHRPLGTLTERRPASGDDFARVKPSAAIARSRTIAYATRSLSPDAMPRCHELTWSSRSSLGVLTALPIIAKASIGKAMTNTRSQSSVKRSREPSLPPELAPLVAESKLTVGPPSSRRRENCRATNTSSCIHHPPHTKRGPQASSQCPQR